MYTHTHTYIYIYTYIYIFAGVNDTVVNQLLSKIDGVDQLNNILVIGMTNRFNEFIMLHIDNFEQLPILIDHIRYEGRSTRKTLWCMLGVTLPRLIT